MPSKSTPRPTENSTVKDSRAYDSWFRKHVQEALNDSSAPFGHEQVMHAAQMIIEAKRSARV